jgi:hypothetical protein
LELGAGAKGTKTVSPSNSSESQKEVSELMIKVVCWNIAKKKDPWHCLAKMAEQGEADVALLQEAGHVPGNLIEKLEVDDKLFWHPMGFDRLPVVVKLSNKVTVERYRQVPVLQILPDDAIGVSDIGTIAAAKVTPEGKPDEAFIVVSMYARWLRVHPSTRSKWIVSAHSAHRISLTLLRSSAIPIPRSTAYWRPVISICSTVPSAKARNGSAPCGAGGRPCR